MLRITITENTTSSVLMLEGKLSGEWVSELRRVWAALQARPVRKPIVLILTELSALDASGRGLLEDMCSSGADLQGSGIGIHGLIDELRSKS